MKQHCMTHLILLVSVLMVFGCSGGDSGSGQNDINGQGTGTLALSLTDAPADGLQAVYITISSVKVCVATSEVDNGDNLDAADDECRWEVIDERNGTYNLLELVNGVTETLGVAELPAGAYHQMRLMIGTELDDDAESVKELNILGEEHPYANYLIDRDGNAHSMKVPSGVQSGVKLVCEFEIDENMDTDLILDFDAHRSIVKAGKKDKYILKPAIKVINTKDMAKLIGTVKDADADEHPIESVAVSAQRKGGPLGLIVEASTTTDETGGYQLLLEKNREYTIVVFSSEYKPACALINISDGDLSSIWDFSLEASESGQVTGTITDVAKEADVSLSFRKIDQACGNGDQEIELSSETIAPDANFDYTYSVVLPVGEGYTVVYSDGVNKSSKIFNVEPEQDPQTPQTENLAFDTDK
jgi:hypothetical protein